MSRPIPEICNLEWHGWQLVTRARVDSRPAPANILPCSASRESRT